MEVAKVMARWDEELNHVTFNWSNIETIADDPHHPNRAIAKMLLAAREEGKAFDRC